MESDQGTGSDAGSSAGAESVETVSSVAEDDMFTDRDLAGEYDETEAVYIILDDDNSSCESDAVQIDGQTVTITEEGIYLISGSLSDGQLIIDAGEDDKVQLVLNGVSVQNTSSAAIYAKEADKVFVTLPEGTENALSMTGDVSSDAANADKINGVIFSTCDLTMNGSGSLTVYSSAGHGIVGKDDVVFAGGTYIINAAKKGVKGNDSIRIASGTLQVEAGTDGLYTKNADDEEKGFIYIKDGALVIDAGDDGIHAASSLMIAGGSVTIEKSGEGLEAPVIVIDGGQIGVTASDDGLNASSGSGGSSDDPLSVDQDASININGGTLHVNAGGDGIDSNGSVTITGGTVEVEGPENDGNGALDVGSEAVITGGTFIATGSSGMAVNFSSSSTQGAILQTVETTTGTAALANENGDMILSMDTDKQYNSVLVSAPEIQEGNTYILTTGGTETSIEMTSLIVGSAGNGGMMGGGMRNGNGSNNGGMPGMRNENGAPSANPGETKGDAAQPDKGNHPGGRGAVFSDDSGMTDPSQGSMQERSGGRDNNPSDGTPAMPDDQNGGNFGDTASAADQV